MYDVFHELQTWKECPYGEAQLRPLTARKREASRGWSLLSDVHLMKGAGQYCSPQLHLPWFFCPWPLCHEMLTAMPFHFLDPYLGDLKAPLMQLALHQLRNIYVRLKSPSWKPSVPSLSPGAAPPELPLPGNALCSVCRTKQC